MSRASISLTLPRQILLFDLELMPVVALRLEDPLRHQLRQGRFLALPDPDRLLLPLDVLDVPQQRLPLHVGGRAHHVSALPGLRSPFHSAALIRMALLRR